MQPDFSGTALHLFSQRWCSLIWKHAGKLIPKILSVLASACFTLWFITVPIPYLYPRSDAVIAWAARILPEALFVMYEQIRPEDPFGTVMQNHFLKLNSKIHALCQYPDTAAQTERLLQKVYLLIKLLDVREIPEPLILCKTSWYWNSRFMIIHD